VMQRSLEAACLDRFTWRGLNRLRKNSLHVLSFWAKRRISLSLHGR